MQNIRKKVLVSNSDTHTLFIYSQSLESLPWIVNCSRKKQSSCTDVLTHYYRGIENNKNKVTNIKYNAGAPHAGGKHAEEKTDGALERRMWYVCADMHTVLDGEVMKS